MSNSDEGASAPTATPEQVASLKEFLQAGSDLGAQLADGTLTAVPPQELGALPNLEEMLEKLFDGMWEQIRTLLRSHGYPDEVIEAYLDCVADGYAKRLDLLLAQPGITGGAA